MELRDPVPPDFSDLAKSYAESRPGYPAALFEWLASLVEPREVAWDAATGSGQAAVGLARYFRHVIATDISEQQILHATRHPRVTYRVGGAEASGLEDRSVNLVAAASALHWFDLPRFSAEVVRVARPGGVVAAWTYHVGHVEPPFDLLLWPFYRDVVGPYFARGASLVDDGYRGISLPGEAIRAPSFFVSVQWTADQMRRFIRTWSGVQAYSQATGNDPVAALSREIDHLWDDPGTVREVRWPLYLLASRV
jgi:SAM-dependent methyltransferase